MRRRHDYRPDPEVTIDEKALPGGVQRILKLCKAFRPYSWAKRHPEVQAQAFTTNDTTNFEGLVVRLPKWRWTFSGRTERVVLTSRAFRAGTTGNRADRIENFLDAILRLEMISAAEVEAYRDWYSKTFDEIDRKRSLVALRHQAESIEDVVIVDLRESPGDAAARLAKIQQLLAFPNLNSLARAADLVRDLRKAVGGFEAGV